jgi:biofilm PGA synthesis N-glycosyltransferase PgaC
MAWIFILLFFLYFVFLRFLIVGWRKGVKESIQSSSGNRPLLSVIVPVRNEETHIANLLQDLQCQSYDHFEVIVVDDHSLDNTAALATAFIKNDSRFRMVHSSGHGKKAAITSGVNKSSGDIIVTTDADCRTNPVWLEEIVKTFDDDSIKMVFGGVKITGTSLFSQMQGHEFLSLVGTAVATWALGVPSMCNGANLAFRKRIFTQVGGYVDNYQIPSGDDEFLMHKIGRLYPDGIRFMSSQQAVVQTIPAESIKAFVHQRVRWAGKWKHSLSPAAMSLGLFIFLFHTSVLLLPLAMYTQRVALVWGMALLLGKATAEAFFLKKVADFLQVPWRWSIFFILQLVYPFYAVFIGLFSTFIPFDWKGRKQRSFSVDVFKGNL